MFTDNDLEFQSYYGIAADNSKSTADIISELSKELLELRTQHRELVMDTSRPTMVTCDECGHEKDKDETEFVCRDCVDDAVDDAKYDCDCEDEDEEDKDDKSKTKDISLDNIIIKTMHETINIESVIGNQLVSLTRDIKPNSIVVITKDEIAMIKSRGF